MQGETWTFLFTDIEGSTRLWQEHSEAMRAALVRHDGLLRDAIESHSGRVVKTTGDGFHAVFDQAADSLAAVLSAQQALLGEPWPPETPLRVRMALHSGEAEPRDGDYFGPAVNRAARLLSIAHGGQMLISQAAVDQVLSALPPDVTLCDLASHRLKDLAQSEHVWQICHPSLPADFPPLRSLQAFANNLPVQVNSFVGRTAEMETLKALLPAHRLVTLTGAGGSGKTRLSLQTAADLVERYGDGVWLVELAALSDPSLVPQAVAAVLGVREESGRALTETLTDYLRSRTVLLLLDNCEHLIQACAALAETLLRSCPGVTLLATSREALGIGGEKTWRIPSLSVPDPNHLPLAEKDMAAILMDCDGVRLFVERARQHGEFVLSRGNAAAVSQVCARLDGIPLALELAAARVKVLSPEQIASRLDDRFRLLTGGSRTALPRQQTLRALVDWSYDLLTEPERLLLTRLSVFAGGLTLEAAEAVCSGEGIEDFDVLDLLARLLDKSLVQTDAPDELAGQAGQTRFRLLETMRQYGEEKISGFELWRGKHRDWCLTLAEEANLFLVGAEAGTWLNRLETEHDNLRSALAWCQQTGDGLSALRLTGILWRFWLARGYMTEGRLLCESALETAGPDAPPEARAFALNGLGNLTFMQCDYEAAEARFRECLQIGLAADDKSGIARSQTNLASVATYAGRPAEARSLLEEALSQYRLMADKKGMANALANLGQLTLRERDLEGAWAALEECVGLQRELGDGIGLAVAKGNLGYLALHQKDYDGAQSLFEEALSIFREHHYLYGIAMSLSSLGGALTAQGRFGAARGLLCESIVLICDIGDLDSGAAVLECLAETDHGRGRSRQAACLGGAAEALREAISSPLPPEAKKEHEEKMTAVQEALGDEAFAAWAMGRAMPWAQAVEYALEDGGR